MNTRDSSDSPAPSRADIAGAVHQAAAELASRVRASRLCFIYTLAGAMVSTQATGTRHVLQVGGYRFQNRPGEMAVLGTAFTGREPRGKLDLHCWFTELPPGADPEDTWDLPPWLTVTDLWLRHLAPVREAAGVPLARKLPDYVWGPASQVRDTAGIEFRPDRPSATRFLGLVTESPESDYWRDHVRIADQAARTAARNLGLPMTIRPWDVVPPSYLTPPECPGGRP